MISGLSKTNITRNWDHHIILEIDGYVYDIDNPEATMLMPIDRYATEILKKDINELSFSRVKFNFRSSRKKRSYWRKLMSFCCCSRNTKK